jgi:hypothetical protein
MDILRGIGSSFIDVLEPGMNRELVEDRIVLLNLQLFAQESVPAAGIRDQARRDVDLLVGEASAIPQA